ncbi:MAG TPA: A/G-specific adenine glycosylase, partial [Acidimicrobiia bacterium]
MPARASALGTWYVEHGRHELPWRTTRDRWTVLVSEVMLHQTQVPRVEAVYTAFLDRFPTPEAMAAGSPGEVVQAWGRLGYPRRARRLWDAARRIVADGWPDDLTKLPGVGRYTAGAVRAQADDVDVAAVDVT